MMINYYKNIKKLLNIKNKNKKNVFHIAVELCKTDIVELLIQYDKQLIDFKLFVNNSNSKSGWMKCLGELISKSKGKILNTFTQNQKDTLLLYTKALLKEKKTSDGLNNNNNNGDEHFEYEYNDLENIVLHLHKDLGIPMTNVLLESPH
eukprot:429147_1